MKARIKELQNDYETRMMKKRDTEDNDLVAKIDTLIVIGNGFDRWQGLDTSYSDFHRYYLEHRDEILKKLHIKKHIYASPSDAEGEKMNEEWSDVEVVFTDPFEPCELEADFWNSFESSLGEIDAERINLFFGKDRAGLRSLNRAVRNAKRILTEAFCGWVASITIDQQKQSDYHFGKNCVFINFNYTETLEKRFGIPESDIYHIHGLASDPKSIVFGHNKHPQVPDMFFRKLGGRFGGLYQIEEMLYETDKHCQDNIQLLCMYLALRGVACEEIKDIYVLGQSMSPVDLEYFDFLMRCSKVNPEEREKDDPIEQEIEQENDWFDTIEYVVDTVGYGREDSSKAFEAMIRRQRREQAEKNRLYEKGFYKMIGKAMPPKGEAIQPQTRIADAKWHVAFYGERDRTWKEYVMKELGCTNFELYSSIDECLNSLQGHCKN